MQKRYTVHDQAMTDEQRQGRLRNKEKANELREQVISNEQARIAHNRVEVANKENLTLEDVVRLLSARVSNPFEMTAPTVNAARLLGEYNGWLEKKQTENNGMQELAELLHKLEMRDAESNGKIKAIGGGA